jgi:hypothetical protein
MPKMLPMISLETQKTVSQPVPKDFLMTPICVCSTSNKAGLELFFKSIELYSPGIPIYLASPLKPSLRPSPFKWIPNTYKNFGEAYNAIMRQAFLDGHEEVIIANDDIVLDPSSYYLLCHDRLQLKQQGVQVGFVAARSNMTSLHMNIRNRLENDVWIGMKWQSEDNIIQVPWVAPLFASVGINGWCGFPPINFYSDNVACHDMEKEGFKHFIGRSYVHHVGSQTIGKGYWLDSRNIVEAEEWLRNNRPELHKLYYGVN